MTLHNDQSLKLALAKMLPDKIGQTHGASKDETILVWFNNDVEYHGKEDEQILAQVLDTELLHLCWLVEQTLNNKQDSEFVSFLAADVSDGSWSTSKAAHASWQRRVATLAKVLEVEIL